jgi:hypothetical protein
VVGFAGGSIAAGSGVWSFALGTEHLFVGSTTVTGSGTFVANQSISGIWRKSIDTSDRTLGFDSYSVANALSVTQASVVGQWGSATADFSVQVDANGNVTGTTSGLNFGSCTVSGSIALLTPGSNRNLFRIKLTPSGDSSCRLYKSEHTGLASIGFTNTALSGAAVWKRNLQFVVRVPSVSYFSAYPLMQ